MQHYRIEKLLSYYLNLSFNLQDSTAYHIFHTELTMYELEQDNMMRSGEGGAVHIHEYLSRLDWGDILADNDKANHIKHDILNCLVVVD